MNRPRMHKILADLWGNRLRSLLVIASISVGLFAVGVIATLHTVVLADMTDGYAAVNPANIQISLSPFDQGLVDHIKKLPGVHQAEGYRIFGLRLEASPGEWIAIDLKAAPDLEKREIGQLRLIEGSWPPGDREIVIEQYELADTHARVGDTVTVELPSHKTRQLKLVGVVGDQTVGAFSGGPGFFLAPVQGYIDQDTVEWLEQERPRAFNTLHIVVDGDTGDEEHIRKVADQVRDEVERIGYSVINTATRSAYDHPNRIFVEGLSAVLMLLGLFVMFLSAFLITSTLQAIILQQVQQIGILKTLGSRRYQVALLYMALIFIFGALAALIAVPLANQVAFRRVAPLTETVNMAFRGARPVPGVIALQVAIALIVPQLAALVPILQGARLSVQEALSGIRQSGGATHSGSRAQKNPIHLRKPGFWRRYLRVRISRPTLISIRNTFRRKGRLVLTLITLSLGGAIFIATFNVQVSMNGYVDQISQYFLADVNVTTTYPQRISKIQDILAGVEGVERVEGWGAARSELVMPDGSVGDNVVLFAPPAGSPLVRPVMLEGRWLKVGDQNAIALNERFRSEFPDMQVGDSLRLRVNGKETDWTIVGFYQLAGRSAGYLAYVNQEYLSELINQPGRSISFRVVASQPGLSSDQQEQLSRRVEARLREEDIRISDISTGSFLSSRSAEGFSALTGFLLFLASLTALVGSIGLAGTMSMNVMERTREIGILRAIGATNPILMRLVVVEGMLIGLISWVIAALLAFPMSKLLIDSISMALFGNPMALELTPTGFLIWLAAVAILAVLASILPARSAARLTIREVLAYE